MTLVEFLTARLDDEAPGLETAVSLLAMPYSEHPDYQQEWKP